ncbi:MAG: ORF6N domain-containing protein [Clostridia bacterium]|nr:ORF6N domain-containing protein [Clostridia bacterium]
MEENKMRMQNEVPNLEIGNLIYTIRGKQVMLDSDVANLYNYQTKRINETVSRNKERFPGNFCFKLTEEEIEELKRVNMVISRDQENNWSQFATSLKNENSKYRGRKYLPLAFTEQGIAMLSGLLKNTIAIQVSINIMNAFVEMRKFMNTNGPIFERLTSVEYKLLEHDKKFEEVFNQFQIEENVKQRIFFEGQIYDAYSLIIDIIKKANKKIFIIDNYIDDSVLKMLTKKKKSVEVVILTSDKSDIQNLDVQKFNKEYPMLKVAKTDRFHDRFIILDDKEMYHLGASIKDLGKKCFGINKIEDMKIIEKIISF